MSVFTAIGSGANPQNLDFNAFPLLRAKRFKNEFVLFGFGTNLGFVLVFSLRGTF